MKIYTKYLDRFIVLFRLSIMDKIQNGSQCGRHNYEIWVVSGVKEDLK